MWGCGLLGYRVVGLCGDGMSGTVPFGAALLGAVGGAAVAVWGLWCGAWDVGAVQSEKITKNKKLIFDHLNQFPEINIIGPKID